METTGYMFDTAAEDERDRLIAQAGVWDPVTRRRLADCGLTEGHRCLEVGAGSGTVTRYLAERVGESGHVVAIDLETRWLHELEAPNVQVLRHDVVTDPLGESVYDLICARLVVAHLPDPRAILDKLFRALRPGGWLLIEECDLRTLPLCDPPDPLWEKVAASPLELVRLAGADPLLGAKLTGLMHAVGATEVDTEAIALPRRMPEIQSWRANFAELREGLISAGLVSPAEVDKVIADFDDQACDLVVYGPTLVSARGRKP